MEKTRKSLKNISIVVLALAGLSFINILFELFFGELGTELNNAVIPEGAPDNILFITRMFILGLSFLLLLPQAYVGIKGLVIARKPNSSVGHIVWGIILIVFTALSLVSPLLSLIQGKGDAFGDFAQVCSIGVDVFVLIEFVRYARAVRKEIK